MPHIRMQGRGTYPHQPTYFPHQALPENYDPTIVERSGRPGRPTWDQEEIKRILAIVKDSIKTLPERKEDEVWRQTFQMMRVLTEVSSVQEETDASLREYEEKRGLVDAKDVMEFLDDAYYRWIDGYLGSQGNYPSDAVRKIAQGLIGGFLFAEETGKTATISNIPYSWIDLTSGKLPHPHYRIIVNTLDPVFDEARVDVENQPLYLTKSNQLGAYLDAAEGLDYIDKVQRSDPRFMEQMRQHWPAIKRELYTQGGGVNPAWETIARRVLTTADGRTGSKSSQDNLGYLMTHFSDDPLTKEMYLERLRAREAVSEVTEETVNEIIEDPKAWLRKHFSNRVLFPEAEITDPESEQRMASFVREGKTTEAKDALNEFYAQKGDELIRQIQRWRTEVTPDGTLRYQPEEIAQLAMNYVRPWIEEAPRPEQIDASVGYEKEVKAEQKKQTEAEETAAKDAEAARVKSLDKIQTPEHAVTAVNNWIKTNASLFGGKFGDEVPEYAQNAMAQYVLNAYSNARITGTPVPNIDDILYNFANVIPNWLQIGKTDISSVAKGILGLTDRTSPEVASRLEGTAEKISDSIQAHLEAYPASNMTPLDWGFNILEQQGITPTGQLAPYSFPRLTEPIPREIEEIEDQPGIDPFTGEMLRGPIGDPMPMDINIPEQVRNVQDMIRGMTGAEIVSQQLDPSRPPGMGGQAVVDAMGGLEPIGSRGVMRMPSLGDYTQQLIPSLETGLEGISPEFAQYLSQQNMSGDSPVSNLFRQFQASQQIPDITEAERREAERELHEGRVASFQRAYDRAVASGKPSLIEQARMSLENAQAQAAREISRGSMASGAALAEELAAQREMTLPSVTAEGVEIPGTAIDPRMVPYYGQASGAVGDIFRSQLPSPQGFLETAMPQLRQGFEASPFFTQQEERIASETEAEEAFAQREADIAERERRVALRPTATSIFGRRT